MGIILIHSLLERRECIKREKLRKIMEKILKGIRIIDLSRYIAGPFCSMLMADMGAEVIKVEKPEKGEASRELTPFQNGVSLFFPAYNRNKKSITLDLRKEEGIEILKKLIAESDVLIENYRVGTMEKMGLSYDIIKKINPRIIVLSVTGFGQTGPLRNHLAFDGVISAMAGVVRMENGHAGRSDGAFHDHFAALYGIIATLLALIDRQKTGKGQYIDVAMYACSALIRNDFMPEAYFNDGKISDEEQPYGFLYTKDGIVYFTAGLGNMYENLLTLVDDPFLHEERFHNVNNRIKHSDEIIEHLQEWAKDMKADELDELLSSADITSAKVLKPGDVVKSQHLWETGFFHMMPVNGIEGGVPYIGVPFKMSEHTDIEYNAAPNLGENNSDVYEDILKMDAKEIDRLKKMNVI